MYTDDDIQQLYNPLAAPTPVSSDPNTWTKRVEQVANIIPQAVNQTVQSVVGIGQALHPEINFGDYAQTVAPVPTFDTGPSTGIGDVLLNRVAPSMAAWMIPYTGISKVLKGVGAAAPLVEGLAQGGANYFTSSADESQTQAGIQGATGLASGILQAALPRWSRALPLAAVSAVNAVATDNPYNAAANFIGNMLWRAHGSPNLGNVMGEAFQPKLGGTSPIEGEWQGPGIDTSLYKINNNYTPPISAPEGIAPNVSTEGLRLNTTGLQLEPASVPLQSIDTSGFNLADYHPEYTENAPSGLQLNHFPSETPLPSEIPQSPSGLQLEGYKPQFRQQDLFRTPQLAQAQSQAKTPLNAFDEFPFAKDIQSQAPQYQDPRQGDLFNQTPQYQSPEQLPLFEPATTAKPLELQDNALPLSDVKASSFVESSPVVETSPSSFVDPQGKVTVTRGDGTVGTIEGRMPGPHVVSTVLDEGDGTYLAGKNWNDPHGQSGGGKPSIFEQHIENASGLGESKFLVQDANGKQAVVGRAEAAPYAEAAGQGKADSTGKLQSQDLQVQPSKAELPAYTVPKALQKFAKSSTLSELDLTSELGHYDDDELKALSDLLHSKSADPADVARSLKEQYGPKGGVGDITTRGQDFSTKGRTDEIDQLPQKVTGMKKPKLGQSGKISPEYAAALGLATVGGAYAYSKSKGDVGVTLAGAVLGLGLGIAGAKAIRALTEATGPAIKAPTKVKIPNESIANKLGQFSKNTAIAANGASITGRGGIFANAVAKAKALSGIGESPIFKDKKLLADGFIARELDELSSSMETAGKVKPSPGAYDAFGKYFRGQLADPVDILRELQNGNAQSGDTWNKMSSAQKTQYPEKWMQVDDANNTNTKGDGVTIYHVTNQTKQALTALQDAALQRHLTTPADLEGSKFVQQARQSVDRMMAVVHAGVPPGPTLNKIIGTMGQYAARSHDVITDPNFWPTEPAIKNAMDQLSSGMEDRFFTQVVDHAVPQPQGSQVTWNGKVYNLTKGEAENYSYLHTPESLRSLVEQHIVDLKKTGAMIKSGLMPTDNAQLGSSLFTGRKELDDVTQALLGTHTEPFQIISDTVNKLVPSTRSAHIMSGLLSSVDEAHGVPFSFVDDIQYNKALQDIKTKIVGSTDPVEIRTLQNKFERLKTYVPVSGQDAKMGLFQGAWMSPEAHSFIAGQENPLGLLDNAFGKSLANFNQVVKATHLILNPAAHARLFFQIPAFLAMAGAASDPGAWKDAFGALKDLSGPIGQKLLKNGVLSTDIVHGELNHGLQELLDGTADKGIWGKIQAGYKNVQALYVYPDHFVRAASFLAEENRQLAKGVSAQDAQDAARAFMTRRTLDYNNVPQYVKIGRNIPFVSMFLGYTHEIMKVAKNLVIDAAHGDLNAGMTLGALGAGPFILQSAAESALSPKDRDAWDIASRTAPAYSRPRFKLPLSRNKDDSFNYIDVTPFFHFNDFEEFARSIKNKDYKAAAEVNPFFGTEETPLINLFSEAITGQDLHTGKEYRNGWDYAKSVAQEVLPPLTPGIGTEWQKALPESLGGNLGITNLKNARTNTIQGALLRNLVGMDYTQINPGIAESNTVKEAQHEIANERQYYIDTVKQQGLSADAKNRAKERFLESVQHIALELHQKINPTQP